MTIKFLSTFLIVITPFFLFAQQGASAERVSSEIEQQVINTYEGFPPMPFEAPDTDGTKHVLANYKGRVVVLYFWSVDVPESWQQIPLLERLRGEYPETELMLLTMAKEDVTDIAFFREKYPFYLPIIPNTDELGSMGFAGELGFPRVFVIDTFGVINELFTGKTFSGERDLYQVLKPYVESMLNYGK